MRALRVAPACQLALDLGDGGSAADRWDGLPEQAHAQVLALLAQMIARGDRRGRHVETTGPARSWLACRQRAGPGAAAVRREDHRELTGPGTPISMSASRR